MDNNMGKRKSKGNVRKKKKEPRSRELIYKDDQQEYAQVLRMLGNGRCELQCMDGIKRLGHIRGALRKKTWISIADFVLVGLREFQDEKCDIIAKYTLEETRTLKCYGELPETLPTPTETEDDVPFDFDDI